MKKFPKLTILGMMSGTSLDGLDLALCEFWKEEERFHYQILKSETFSYPPLLAQQLKELYFESALFLCHIEVEFSNFAAICVNQFLQTTDDTPDYLSFHGHTVFHQPEKGLTKQIGSGAILAARTGIPTICDFRTTDVALGGQGAPLVPIGDALLFPQYAGCLNLGGISNISKYDMKMDNAHTSSGKARLNPTAYDISLCNIPLNYLASQCGFPFDENGTLAQKGTLILELLEELNKPDYFNIGSGKKSIGYEFFANYYKPLLDNFPTTIENKLRTMCEHITIQISQNLKNMTSVLVTGGGAKNRFLISLIKEKTDTNIIIPDTQIIDFKEALIFAFLGYLRVLEVNNCLKSVTGASKDSRGGAIYL